jgi:hypothetical protein
MSEAACEHKFVHLRTAKWTDDSGGYSTGYFRVDTFFCEQCLQYKRIKQEGYHRGHPEWYKGE